MAPYIHHTYNIKKESDSDISDVVRLGEQFVSDDKAIDCVHHLLQKGKEAKKEPVPTTEFIPLLIIPVTVDYVDFKTLMCNLTIPVHYFMIIHNGEHEKLAHLLSVMSETLLPMHKTELHIIHHPENTGYAAAVNEGLRFALSHSFEEIPWVYVTNSDVRFHPLRLQSLSRVIAERTHNDVQMIALLEKERQQEIEELLLEEQQENTQSVNVTSSMYKWQEMRRNYTLSLLQHGSVTVNINSVEGANMDWEESIKSDEMIHYVTVAMSSLLPRRIRQRSASDMSSSFAEHTGLFFANSRFEMSSFAISHLHLRTVGLLDENFYPAYGEDFDYKWRSAALGFQFYVSPAHEFIHYENANLQVGMMQNPLRLPRCTRYHSNEDKKYSSINSNINKNGSCGQLIKFKRMNYQPIRLHYRRSKWFPFSSRLIVDTNRSTLPFTGALPIDV